MIFKKAQASLEMVIGLVILLVVAGVVISLVLFFIKPKQIEQLTSGIEWDKFINDCKQKCETRNYADYCSYYWKGDFNKNTITPEAVQVGAPYNWYACEDRIYCFLVAPCEDLGSGREVIESCRNILCQRFIDKGYDVAQASSLLANEIKLSEKTFCANQYKIKARGVENWYSIFEEGCGAGGGGGGGGITPPPLPPP